MVGTEDKYLSLSKMNVDYSYQRELKNERVKAILRKFKDDKVNIIRVSERQDGYYIVDGQHTAQVLRTIYGNDKCVLCRVYHGLSVQEEAKLFTELNTGQKKTSYNENMKAHICQGEEDYVSYISVFDEYKIPYTFSGRSRDGVKFHSTAFRAYKFLGIEIFRNVMIMMSKSFLVHEITSDIFAGLVTFYSIYQTFDEQRLNKVLLNTNSKEILTKARAYGISHKNSPNNIPVASVMVDLYNKGLKARRLDKTHLLTIS